MSSHDNRPLYKIYWKFLHHTKYLKHLQNETLEAIENVGRSGNLNEDQLGALRFRNSEIDQLKRILHIPVCIICMGQNTYGKLALASLLLEKQVVSFGQLQNCSSEFCKPLRFYSPISESSKLNEQKSQYFNSTLKDNCKTLETFSLDDIEFSEKNIEDNEVVHIAVSHPLLKESMQIVVAPNYPEKFRKNSEAFIDNLLPNVFPIVLYAITSSRFTEKETYNLQHMKELFPDVPILFIEVPPLPSSFSSDLPESEQHDVLCTLGILQRSPHNNNKPEPHANINNQRKSAAYHRISEELMYTLCEIIGYLQPEIPPQHLSQRIIDGELQIYSDFVNNIKYFNKIKNFIYLVLHGQLIRAATILHKRHSKCMRKIILFAFDVAREIQITPKRINYAKEKEIELYENLMTIASIKQDEIREVILESLAEMREKVFSLVSTHEFEGLEANTSVLEVSTREIRLCTSEIQDLIMSTLNESVGRQMAARLNVMRESYLGTLQRCLENLESDCRVCGESPNIGDALKQMLNAAYEVEVTNTTSFLRTFWEKMKRLVITMPGRNPPIIDSEWKQKVAFDILTSLSESKLAKNICMQFRELLKESHEAFVVGMKQLESQLVCRLEEKEESHLRIKKVDAPKLARLSLESRSLRDRILYGMPQLEREIGRGQYGVVFGCKSWGGHQPCAIKSLVPLDDKHWNDLSMEFHYTRSVPEHDNIVILRGSVIDYSYAQGDTPAVLLIMDRLNRDLYSGLKSGLEWKIRMQISLDVTRGIRFLHSQGLVHRDIKLKNVLLDPNCRAKLTDLGFCKPEAMISGSIVGTPIHMAPELFTGHYDNSVDVYAFGILFWYICSGQVKLPYVFEQCHSKDHLWNCVKKGGRPERLESFSDECWNLMSACWEADPGDRPFLGTVEPQLQSIMEKAQEIKKVEKPEVAPIKDEINLEASLTIKE